LRRWEWNEQVKLARLLERWMPADAFWTATDPVAGSPLSGFMRRKRGVRAGTPDNLVLHCGRFVAIELKSPTGTLSPTQREARLKILAGGGLWWLCKSANSAMWALAESGVRFREVAHNDGSVERWEQPDLEPWEIPRRSPHERRAMHPASLARDRTYRERRRARVLAAQAASAVPATISVNVDARPASELKALAY
jgi:hypothetical protein